MTGMANGIAHVSFAGGGFFVPARTPYDRQMLVEHVVGRVRTKGQVQVLIDDQRWMVYARRAGSTARCANCGRRTDSTCYAGPNSHTPYCARCAFGTDACSPPLELDARRCVG